MTQPTALAGLDQVGQLEHSSVSNKEQKTSTISNTVAIPDDDPRRNLVMANPDTYLWDRRIGQS